MSLSGIVKALTIRDIYIFLQWRPELPSPALPIPTLGMIDLETSVV